MTKMEHREIVDTLERRKEEYEEFDSLQALKEPVDASKFYRFVDSITGLNISDEAVEVTFRKPAPSASKQLSDDYSYTVAVARSSSELSSASYARAGMPKDDLITLHQVAIVVWSLATGMVY
jgi:hypothetical protein